MGIPGAALLARTSLGNLETVMTYTHHSKIIVGAVLLLAAAALGPWTATVSAQERDVPAGTRTESSNGRVSPGGAFFRSLLLPGWGQAAVGSYGRGGFYFATESVVAWMLFKTNRRQRASRAILSLREGEAEAFHMALGVTDPDSLLALIEADPLVTDARALDEVRSQQFEDWLAFGVFMLFLSGADAFVAAHLADFPEPLTPGFQALPDGGFEASLSITVPPGWPGS